MRCILGDKNLQAPNLGKYVIENREWMYQQPHLPIEIQYYWNSEYDTGFLLNPRSQNGLQQINFSANNTPHIIEKLTGNNIPFSEEAHTIVFESPDTHVISCKNL